MHRLGATGTKGWFRLSAEIKVMKASSKIITQTFNVFNKYTAEILPKNSIRVTRENEKPNTFVIGDWAEYDSYNLHYDGIIRSITEKTVTIESYPGTQNAKKHRLKIDEFCWRNWDYDKVKVSMENSDTMNYI
jgi:hypothetical protein